MSKNFVFKLKDILDGDKEVVGFVLVGSHTRDKIYQATPYSDIEAYIILKENIDKESIEKRLPKILNRLGKVIFTYKNQWAGFSGVFDNLLRIELPVIKESDIESTFSRPKAQTVKVIIDKTNGKLEHVLNKRPSGIDFEKFYENLVKDFWYMSIVAVQYYKKGELWNSRHIMEVALTPRIIQLMELLENKEILLLESRKRIEQFISKDKQKILSQISSRYLNKEVHDSLRLSINIFIDLAKQVAGKYNYKYPLNLEKDIKNKLEKQLSN